MKSNLHFSFGRQRIQMFHVVKNYYTTETKKQDTTVMKSKFYLIWEAKNTSVSDKSSGDWLATLPDDHNGMKKE